HSCFSAFGLLVYWLWAVDPALIIICIDRWLLLYSRACIFLSSQSLLRCSKFLIIRSSRGGSISFICSLHGALNNKVTRPVPSPTFKDKGNVLGNIGCNQADSRSQFSCSDFTEHFRGASKPGIRISQSPNNSGELPYTESGKKLKDQISSFSSYEKGSTSNSVTQDTCVATDITHNADKSFICMNCYKFLTEIAEKSSGLSALLPTNQVYELPHNPSAKTRRSAGY
ncbi:unnamed protein product, partial [Coffea canephora]